MKRVPALIGIILSALLAFACSPSVDISVSEYWARPGIQEGNSAVYFIIENNTAEDEVLLSAASDAANYVELHRSSMTEDGTMMMQQQESIPIPANSSVALEPGGLHVMLIELTQDLTPGDQLALRLNFQKSGTRELEVTVREP